MVRWLVAMLCAVVAGCGESPADAVKAQYQRGEDAIRIGDIAEMKNTMTSESLAYAQETLRLAATATEREVKAMGPARMQAIIALRNRVAPERLKAMTVDQYFTWMIDEEQLVVDADYDIYPHSVLIRGDTAILRRGILVEDSFRTPRLGRRGRGAIGGIARALSDNSTIELIEELDIHFVNLGGYWYYDEVAGISDHDAFMHLLAAEEQMHVIDYILAYEREEHGSLKPNLWQPPR